MRQLELEERKIAAIAIDDRDGLTLLYPLSLVKRSPFSLIGLPVDCAMTVEQTFERNSL